jgi:hypothetical protein
MHRKSILKGKFFIKHAVAISYQLSAFSQEKEYRRQQTEWKK